MSGKDGPVLQPGREREADKEEEKVWKSEMSNLEGINYSSFVFEGKEKLLKNYIPAALVEHPSVFLSLPTERWAGYSS